MDLANKFSGGILWVSRAQFFGINQKNTINGVWLKFSMLFLFFIEWNGACPSDRGLGFLNFEEFIVFCLGFKPFQ